MTAAMSLRDWLPLTTPRVSRIKGFPNAIYAAAEAWLAQREEVTT